MASSNPFSNKVFRVIVDIIILILGIVMIAVPNATLRGITIVLGIVLLGYGAISMIAAVSRGEESGLAGPVVCAVLGILLLVFSGVFANTVLPFAIGVWMLVLGVINLTGARRAGLSAVNTVLCAAAIVIGVIILIGVFVGHNTLGTLLGVCMLVYGVAAVVNWITMGRELRVS
jgi:uncharacterized membrane protein HdeD (DUF308 family)